MGKKIPPAEVVLHQEGSIERLYGGVTGLRTGAPQPEQNLETFFRVVRIVPPFLSRLSLEQVLGRVDRELQIISEMTEAEPVGHTWGLYPSPGTKMRAPTPSGQLLVAEVDYIEPVEGELPLSVYRGLTRYARRKALHRYGLGDMYEKQFFQGINYNSPDKATCTARVYMPDIEPICTGLPLLPTAAGTIIVPISMQRDLETDKLEAWLHFYSPIGGYIFR